MEMVMKKMTCFFLVSVLVALVQGCASGPGFSDVKGTIPPLSADKGRIYFYRTAVFGAAVQPAVRLDGVEVGTAQPKGCFYVDVAPGSHFVETTTEVSRRLTFTLDKNETRYVRLSMAMGFFVGHAYPELVDSAVGEKEVATCNYTGGKK